MFKCLIAVKPDPVVTPVPVTYTEDDEGRI